jgi:hypothetical protein
MLLLAIAAAASAWLVTRKAPQHRPLAWALTLCAALDAVRLFGLPTRIDMSLVLALPFISRWAYGTIFDQDRPGAILYPLWLIPVWIGPWHWDALLAWAYGLACALGALNAAQWALRGRYFGISQRVALILLAGDALAVASLCAREWIHWQAGVVLATVTVYQLTWWWRWTYGNQE